MTGNREDRLNQQEPGPPPHDELDALLRKWHQQCADQAAASRDRLLRALAEERRAATQAEQPTSNIPIVRTVVQAMGTHRYKRVAAFVAVLLGVVAVALMFWPLSRTGAALAMELRQVGFAPGLPPAPGIWIELDDPDEVSEAEAAIEAAREELEQALAIGQEAIQNPWIPWTKLYRNLRSLGRWEEALDEMHKFAAYAEEQDQTPDRYTMYYTSLSDLGNTYAALGDYETALAYHEESLDVARDYQEWYHRTGRSEDRRPHAHAWALAFTLAPRLWALSTLAAAQGDQNTAWDYHNQADTLLAESLRQKCAFRGLSVSPDASLYDLCMALAPVSDRSFETLAVVVRQHLLNEASLLRTDRNADAARDILELAKTIPDYARADDFRQDFYIPMEELRIAIARGDFAAALAAADQAEQHAGPRDRKPLIDQPPIGPLARAELQFLRGVALAGLYPDDPEALRLIESAINSVHQSATPLPKTRREQLIERFAEWNRVADVLRRTIEPVERALGIPTSRAIPAWCHVIRQLFPLHSSEFTCRRIENAFREFHPKVGRGQSPLSSSHHESAIDDTA